MSMTKEKTVAYYVEGPDWEISVSVNADVHDDERSQLIEAATLAIESRIKDEENLNLGAVLLVKKSKKAQKEAMVNAYLCLVNAGQYKIAESLRENFKKETGNDLATDEKGYSY